MTDTTSERRNPALGSLTLQAPKVPEPRVRLALLVCAPDLAAQELWGAVLQRLQQEACTPVYAIAHAFTAADTICMYSGFTSYAPEEGRTHAAWLTPALFSMGASVFLFVRVERESDAPQQAIAAIKGRSTRALHNSSQTLRSLSTLTDRCLGLLHAPDDLRECLSNLAILMRSDEALTILRSGGEAPALSTHVLQALAPPISPQSGQSNVEITANLLLQGLAALLADPRIAGPRLPASTLFDSVRSLRHALRSGLTEPRFWLQLQQHEQPLRQLDSEIGDALVTEESPDAVLRLSRRLLLQILVQLVRVQEYSPQVAKRVLDVFRLNGLYVCPWDRHRLNVIMSFPCEALDSGATNVVLE